MITADYRVGVKLPSNYLTQVIDIQAGPTGDDRVSRTQAQGVYRILEASVTIVPADTNDRVKIEAEDRTQVTRAATLLSNIIDTAIFEVAA